ncbi:MAG: 2-C-methyl-D-erythritol 4-phosphate cytidylyltransferase [Elusimicrobia bacterium]|nr:2-C-methyl-D-erythritol 4-phosphate cytidylyltransferase [Candidatus Obscuribacterium magneticum]
MSTGVVLLAAGSSRRFGGLLPKQFISLAGEPLFLKSFHLFHRISSVGEIVVVVSQKDWDRANRWVQRTPLSKRVAVVVGGRHRGQSVQKGLVALSEKADVVLIHDAARPLVTTEVIRRVERAARKHGAALAAWPLPDTLKLAGAGAWVKKTIPRKGLWLAQTPQGFRREVAMKCLRAPTPTATDDVELAERRGFKVKIVRGDMKNIKVTYPADLDLCRAWGQKR